MEIQKLEEKLMKKKEQRKKLDMEIKQLEEKIFSLIQTSLMRAANCKNLSVKQYELITAAINDGQLEKFLKQYEAGGKEQHEEKN